MEPGADVPLSAHFVNNVLAAAASYIEDDPEYARDVLAELGQFLSFRLRKDSGVVPIRQELAHVASFLRLQQARFPDRIDVELPPADATSGRFVQPGSLQREIADALSKRLNEQAGPCRVVLRMSGDDIALGVGDPAADGPELLPIDLTKPEGAHQ